MHCRKCAWYISIRKSAHTQLSHTWKSLWRVMQTRSARAKRRSSLFSGRDRRASTLFWPVKINHFTPDFHHRNHFSISNWLQLRARLSWWKNFIFLVIFDERERRKKNVENNQSKILLFCSTVWLSFIVKEVRFNYSETDFLIQSNFNTLPISIPLTESQKKKLQTRAMSERKKKTFLCYSRVDREREEVCWIERKSELRELYATSKIAERSMIRCLHTVQLLRRK